MKSRIPPERLDPEPIAVDTARNGKHPTSGKFLPGNKLAARRHSRREWREAFDTAFTPDDMRAVVRKAVEQAKNGDHHARQWLGEYALGRPSFRIDATLDLSDQNEDADWNYADGPNPAHDEFA
jgi:hypothetical protein